MSNDTPETLRDVFELACPKCSQANKLILEISCMAELTSDGTEPYGDQEWDDHSCCGCTRCGHGGTVRDFRVPAASAEESKSGQHEYLFDAKLFSSLRVTASTEAEARRILAELLDCATVDCGALPDGSPLTAEASLDGELDLLEVDGEPTS